MANRPPEQQHLVPMLEPMRKHCGLLPAQPSADSGYVDASGMARTRSREIREIRHFEQGHVDSFGGRGDKAAMDRPEIAVRPLEPADLSATAALLTAAFEADPAYAFLFPHRQERREGLEDFFTRNLRTHLPYCCTHVAAIGSEVVATVTMRPPDGLSISILTMIRRGLLPFALAHGLRAVRRVFAVKKTYDAIEAKLARGERHWLVHMMAVDPARQGHGLGSRLLGRVLKSTVDAPAMPGRPPCVLTTHNRRNVIFYERGGFELVGVEDVSMMGDAPYPVWCMRRSSGAESR